MVMEMCDRVTMDDEEDLNDGDDDVPCSYVTRTIIKIGDSGYD